METKNLIVMISGRQGAGKTTLANALAGWAVDVDKYWIYTLKFADPLYEMHAAIYNTLENYGEPRPDKIDGNLLQILGTEWGRKCLDQNLWVRILWRRISKILSENKWPRPKLILIDDARMPNELNAFDFIHGVDVFKLRLECNEGARKARAAKWRPNTMHTSETALDNFEHWSNIIYTDVNDATATFELTKRAIEERLK